MVLPEGANEEDVGRPHSSRKLYLVLGALAVAIGAVVLGALTSPDPPPLTTPEAVPETSTITTAPNPGLVDVDEFSVEQIEVGGHLEWEQAASFEEFFPQTLVEHEGWIYLFGQARPIWEGDPGRVVAWRSQDGTQWEELGDVLGVDAAIIAVSSTTQGLVAVERDSQDGELGVWTSDDALSWTPRPIPMSPDKPYLVTYPQAIFADQEMLIVVASQRADFEALIEEHLRRTDRDTDISLNRGWGIDYTEEGTVITVYGPLGMAALSVPIDELGLTEAEITEAESGFGGGSASTPVWTSPGDGEWIETSIEGAEWIDSLVETNRGDLLAMGYSRSGEQTWSSIDGITWEEHEDDQSPSRVRNWGERLVAASNNSPEVLVSDDAVSWEESGLRRFFPAPIDWYVSDLTADSAGIAVAVEGWSQTSGPAPRPDAPQITRDGVTVTMDFSSGRFETEVDDETLTWTVYGQPVEDAIEVDLVDSAVTFLHPETGEPLLTLTFEEVERAEQEYWMGGSSDARFSAIALSADGTEWTIQGVEEELGREARVADIELADRRLVALTVTGIDYYSPYPTPGFEVWTAPVP